jgi:hypothetical protein
MSVGELESLLATIKDKSISVVLGAGEFLEDICMTDSKIMMIAFSDTGEQEKLLVLSPCYCDIEIEDDMDEDEINSHPELN